MTVNPYFSLPTVTGATSSTTDLLASVAKADVASQDAITLKTEIQGQLQPAGTNYGGSFQQGLGTSYNTNPTRSWNGAGAFPQYAVSADGRIVPYINFLDKTAGAGMQFGLPPSVNDVEANLKGIDPYGYAQGGGGVSLAQENAQLKAMLAQLTGGYPQPTLYGAGTNAGFGSDLSLPLVGLPLVGGGVAK
jgi:hypothetical protein